MRLEAITADGWLARGLLDSVTTAFGGGYVTSGLGNSLEWGLEPTMIVTTFTTEAGAATIFTDLVQVWLDASGEDSVIVVVDAIDATFLTNQNKAQVVA